MKLAASFLGILIGLGTASQALGASHHVEATPDSTVWLVGDSTLHPFTNRTADLKASGTLDPKKIAETPSAPPFDAVLQRSALKTFDLVIPVTSLKSKEPALDQNLFKALKAESCPDISFHLSSYAVSKDTASVENFHAHMKGTLAIACQERPVILETSVAVDSETLRVQGLYTLLMTDYGVKPPTMMMGAIKVKNPVVIHFDLQLVQAD